MNFYHKFLPTYSRPRQAREVEVSDTYLDHEEVTTSNATKEALARSSLPKADTPTCLTTDASDTAIRVLLQQHNNGTWHPISVFSKKMTPAETRYSTYDRELLAVYLASTYVISWKADSSMYLQITDYSLHTQHPLLSPLTQTSSSAWIHFSIHFHY